MKSYILGIDIGGTHIDIVAVDHEDNIIACHKQLVSENLEEDVIQAINTLLLSGLDSRNCKSIHLGTTLAINSLLELKSLHRVGVLRIAGHQPELPPAFNWPHDKRHAIVAGFETIDGGFEYDKKSISQFSPEEVIEALDKLMAMGSKSIAVVGVFSPLYTDEEKRVAQLILDSNYGDVPVSLSHQVGGLGFIERENNTIINATLKKAIKKQFAYLACELKKTGLNCDVFITQNNGTLLSLEQALHFPIRTISSGPTNSLNGACKLAQLQNAIVVDIGGTSTEIGVVENGFPRYSSQGAKIAGIPTNFMLPAIDVLALGGGSVIRHQHGEHVIGPDSVGATLFSRSKLFHGDVLTLFDVGHVLQHQGIIPGLSLAEATIIMQKFMTQIEDKIKSIYIDGPVQILFVGGGAENIPQQFLSENMLQPTHYQVANAFGAALAEVCGSIDEIHQLAHDRQQTMERLECSAINQARSEGADPDSIRIIEKRLLPFFYMENQLTRIIITAAGRKVIGSTC
jgi:N-methylhydantoinase A/oxoprolinase/acetone carboxylase beta subunit